MRLQLGLRAGSGAWPVLATVLALVAVPMAGAVLAAGPTPATRPVPAARPVPTTSGMLTGRGAGSGVTAFLGIPYAAPPVGAGRWSAPRPFAGNAARQATAFGPGCLQADTPVGDPWSKEYYAQGPFSEDCLTLNVWAPRATVPSPTAPRPAAPNSGRKLAVAVWIHGGGLVQGSSALPIYDGANLAAQGIVFVSINYRLNVPGFLAHPDIARTSPDGVSGNYGLMDDIAALKWVKRNIAAFGGDPARVTIIGQSGGARSVQSLLFSPAAKGLFRGAIAESGIPSVIPGQGQEPGTRDEQYASGEAFAASRGVSTAAQLRALPASRIIAPAPDTPFRGGFTVDGVWLPKSWAESVTARPVNDVPVMMGHNLDEGDVRQPMTQPVGRDEYLARVLKIYGADADRFLAIYPAAADSTRVARESGHDRVMAGVADWATKRAAAARSKVYVFEFAHRMPGPVHDSWGAYHSSEIVYWTRNLDKLDRPWAADDRQVSRVLSGYWLNFIKTGQPNGAGLPAWQPWSAANRRLMELDATPRLRAPVGPVGTAFFGSWYARQR
jgi:para-nitrobenzyl esterase